jgi:hypothetical protein
MLLGPGVKMGLLGDVGDPVKDVAALTPLVDKAIVQLAAQLKQVLSTTLDGMTITITIARKP